MAPSKNQVYRYEVCFDYPNIKQKYNQNIIFRNRLENNAEYWNALLLSLRELIEWVIRKDTELSSLTLVRENPPSIQKQQVNIF